MTTLTHPTAAPSLTGDILLDAGTNELEVLVFKLCGGWFGVNVAKVREVIRPVKTIAAPHQHPAVMGMFNIRGTVMPVVNLAKRLDLHPGWSKGRAASATKDQTEEGRVIIMEFNGFRAGFLVDAVEQIYRISWTDVRPAPDLSTSDYSKPGELVSTTTGIVEIKGRLVQMIDFESVADSILMQEKLRLESVDNTLNADRNQRVLIVEDSPFMRNLIRKVFLASGYAKLEVYADGMAAWEALSAPGKPVPAAVVSDIEMPRMDGLHLTRRIRAARELRDVPVILFSSLISEDNLKKGQQVGATAQISKPELAEMVRLVDKVLAGLPVE